MRRLFTILLSVLFNVTAFSQVPEKMSYQCVVRDASNALVTNHSVGIRISILQGSASGTIVYQETYNPEPQTNSNGLVSIEVGGGVPAKGKFSNIWWRWGPYFIKTELDPTGGTNYTITGISQLLSVPYAMYAENVAGMDSVFRELAYLRSVSGINIVYDNQNRICNTIKIGSQYWMAEDLRVTNYNNGDPIGTTLGDVTQEENPKYVWPSCNSGNYYTYWVLTDPRGVCPDGFRIANNQDWTNLFTYLGNDNDLLGKLLAPDGGGGPLPIPISNESGLSLRISGSRNQSGIGSDCSPFGWYWCVDAVDPNLAHMIAFAYHSTNITGPGAGFTPNNVGIFVRCIKK